MKKIIDFIFKIERWLCAYLIAQIMIVMFVATVGRYTQWYALSWSEELTRYTMVWLVFIGSGIGCYLGLHFNVDILVEKLNATGKKICLILRMIVIYAFCIFTTYQGVFVVKRQIAGGQLSAALKIPMWFMYSAVPIGCILILLHYTGYAKVLWNEINEGVVRDEISEIIAENVEEPKK